MHVNFQKLSEEKCAANWNKAFPYVFLFKRKELKLKKGTMLFKPFFLYQEFLTYL
jgi:hypothetical protein